MRIDRLLSLSNYGSRSQVKELLRAGKVRVDDCIIYDPKTQINDPKSVHVTVDGTSVHYQDYRYLCLNKPDACLTAMDDARLPTVAQFLTNQDIIRKVHPIGRLDYHTTGLLIFTNDGHLTHRLLSRRWKIKKTYLVQYDGLPLGREEIALFKVGLCINDRPNERLNLAPAELEIIDDQNCRITITEGKTHQVKRILAAVDRSVITLHRETFGGIKLHPDQSAGILRPLESSEIKHLYTLTQLPQTSNK